MPDICPPGKFSCIVTLYGAACNNAGMFYGQNGLRTQAVLDLRVRVQGIYSLFVKCPSQIDKFFTK